MKLYKSLNTIPIYNFYQIQQENDFRYLIKGDVDELPEMEPEKKHFEIYENMFSELKNLDDSLQIVYIKLIKLFSQYLSFGTEKLRTKINIKFNNYLKKIAENNTNFEWNGHIEENPIDLFRIYQKEKKDFFNNMIYDFSFWTMKCDTLQKWNLDNETTDLESILKNSIDVLTCTASKFFAYREKANKINNANN